MKHAMLYVGHGNAVKKARELKDLLEKRDFRVVIVPISDGESVELDVGDDYIYHGKDIKIIENFLKQETAR